MSSGNYHQASRTYRTQQRNEFRQSTSMIKLAKTYRT